jgi:hypothetical protein
VTPASVLPTLVAFVLANVLGLPGGSPLTGTPLAGTPLTGTAGPTVSTGTATQARTQPRPQARTQARTQPRTQARAQTRTQAPASGTMSTAADTARVAHSGPTTPGHAGPGPGAALAALAYRLSIDRPGRLLSTPAGGHPAGTDFSSFRSRAPPLTP